MTHIENTTEKKEEKKEEAKHPASFQLNLKKDGVVNEEKFEEMMKAGVLYGHKKTRKNPHFSDYVFTVRNGIELIDLSKTLAAIDIVSQMLKKFVAEKKRILVIGTQPAAHDAVEKLSAALEGSSYVTKKWIGGLITNFPVLSKRLATYKKMKKDFEEGKFEKYTKRERLLLERDIQKMSNKFEGLEDYEALPDVVFVIDTSLKNHITALREAQKKGNVVMGIIDTDDNPHDFDYFIPANDHSKKAIEWVVDSIIANLS